MSAAQGFDTDIIYIPLLEEGVPVVRPTRGRRMGEDQFFVLPSPDYDPVIESWEFPPGSVVQCVIELHDGEKISVARKLIRAAAE